MSPLAQVIATKNLSDVLDYLTAAAKESVDIRDQPSLNSCVLVCAMWANAILSEFTQAADAPSIAKCMLRDCHALAAIA